MPECLNHEKARLHDCKRAFSRLAVRRFDQCDEIGEILHEQREHERRHGVFFHRFARRVGGCLEPLQRVTGVLDMRLLIAPVGIERACQLP